MHMSDEDLAALLDRTEGWAVALRLAAGFLAESHGRRSIADFTGDVAGMADYLTDEVLRGQPPSIRRFLLYTSICENVCGDLADAITLGAAGQKTLEDLERVNHFVVRLGPKPLWFRYHHLVRDALGTGCWWRPRRWCHSCTGARRAGTRARFDHRGPGTRGRARDWEYVGRLSARAAR
jgi:LuxR family maltose regulon positive regulatory protein